MQDASQPHKIFGSSINTVNPLHLPIVVASTRSSVHEKSPHISIKVIILFPFPFFRVHLICLVGVVLHQDSSMVHPSWTTDYIMTLESLPFHLEFVTSSLLPSDKGLNYHHRPSFNPSNPNTLVYPVSYQNDN